MHLTDRQEVAFRLRQEGWTQVEIASEMGVSQPRVHYLLRAADRRLWGLPSARSTAASVEYLDTVADNQVRAVL